MMDILGIISELSKQQMLLKIIVKDKIPSKYETFGVTDLFHLYHYLFWTENRYG